MSHPETWAKKQDPLEGTYVSPRDVGKKQDPLGGVVWGQTVPCPLPLGWGVGAY